MLHTQPIKTSKYLLLNAIQGSFVTSTITLPAPSKSSLSSGQCKDLFSWPPLCPDRLWGPSSLPSNENRVRMFISQVAEGTQCCHGAIHSVRCTWFYRS